MEGGFVVFDEVSITHENSVLIKSRKRERIEKKEEKTRKKERKYESNLSTLSEEVLNLTIKLGGDFVNKKPRLYRYNRTIPKTIQFFIDANCKTEGIKLRSKIFNIESFMFTREYLIEQFEDYKFLTENSDFIIFGDGDVMICSKQDEVQDESDFNIYIVYDFNNFVIGPIKLSFFLKTLEIIE